MSSVCFTLGSAKRGIVIHLRFTASPQELPWFDNMARRRPLNPLNGITLEMMLERLVAHLGWEKMGQQIPIRCFTLDPSIPSSLKFLRKTPWARTKVEWLYRNQQKRMVLPAEDSADGLQDHTTQSP